jgi:hypothetical protein
MPPLDARPQVWIALAGLIQIGRPLARVAALQGFGKEGLLIHDALPGGPSPTSRLSATWTRETRTDSAFF